MKTTSRIELILLPFFFEGGELFGEGIRFWFYLVNRSFRALL